MIPELVPVKAFYSEWFVARHLDMSPSVAGQEWQFRFEENNLGIGLPKMPPPEQKVGDPHALASIHAWNADGDVIAASVNAICVRIHSLQFEIAAEAVRYPAANVSLHSDDQKTKMDAETTRYYLLARRALQHWLRISRWKMNAPLLGIGDESRETFSAARLINESTENAFWAACESFMVIAPVQYRVHPDNWQKVNLALQNNEEPPVWEEYRASARRRLNDRDLIAATIDMAVSAEAAIRSAVNATLDATTSRGVRNKIAMLNLVEILTKWEEFGLPNPAGPCSIEKGQIDQLISARNGLMHRGRASQITPKWCAQRANDLDKLLAALCP